jgi:ribosomal protein L22
MSAETPADPPEGAADATPQTPAAGKATAKPARAPRVADAEATAQQPTAAKAGGEKASTAKKAPAKKAAAAKATAEKATADKPAAPKKAAPKKAASAKKPVGEKAADKQAERGASSRKASKAAAKAPRRRVVRAHARYVRTSARKARMVCGHLRGKSVQEARAILAFTPREVARDWSKLLESAVANAESNHELLEDDLIVREAYADEGPTIKRFRPRAMGRATPIRKRTSHLTITLTPRPEPGTTKRHG